MSLSLAKRVTREHAAVFVSDPKRGIQPLPVVTSTCAGRCRRMVDLADRSAYDLTRVNGDSEYGYEPIHLACY